MSPAGSANTDDSEAVKPSDALLGQIVSDRYRVIDVIGEGAMGVVYLAEHVHMRKRYALKVLRAEAMKSPEIVARFEREAVAAANIVHPGIAAATDFGRLEDGAFFLVLEHVAGRSLRFVLDEGPVQPARALGVARQIFLALRAAHAAGVVHRDIKPENIMLVDRTAGTGTGVDLVKVLDFGIAKVEGSWGEEGAPLTRLGLIYGTPAYLSPEQAMGETVDPRADLYSVGLLLFEMISGEPPFTGEGLMVVAQQVHEPPPPLTSPLAPDAVTPELAAYVDRLLAKSPDARPKDAEEAIAGIDLLLERLAPRRPISERPSGRSATRAEAAKPSSVPSGSARSADAPPRSKAHSASRRWEPYLAPWAARVGVTPAELALMGSGLVLVTLLAVALLAVGRPSRANADRDLRAASDEGSTMEARRVAGPLGPLGAAAPADSAAASSSAPAAASISISRPSLHPAPSQSAGAHPARAPKKPRGFFNKIKSIFK